MNFRHRLRKLEARIPQPSRPVTLVWISDGVPSYVLTPDLDELHGGDAVLYMKDQDRIEDRIAAE